MDLTLHLTTRADDSHATPVIGLYWVIYSHKNFPIMSRAGKVLRVVSN
jgi:hypothetical protein